MTSTPISRWLARTNIVNFTIYSSVAAFSAYFCMYAFRKPFAAATYDGLSLWGIDYKIVLIIAQVIGYTLSKLIGIKYISEVPAHRRVFSIVVLIIFAEVALLFVGLVSHPYNFVFMFLNGLPLGMIWGLIFSFLEGRRNTEILAACLSASFIVSSGVVKAVGQYTMDIWQVPEFWMPFVTGLIFIGPMMFFVAMLSQIPKPNAQDVHKRTERVPMTVHDRRRYLKNILFGLSFLLVVHMMLTAYRDFRDLFAKEILSSIGYHDPEYLALSEIPIALGVLVVLGSTTFILSNRKAFAVVHLLMFGGVLLAGVSTALLQAELLPSYAWFIVVGMGLYVAYVPFHSILFERLVAVFQDKANAGYLIYLADYTGYLASVGVLLYKNFGAYEISFKDFFISASYGLSLAGGVTILISLLFFMRKTTTKETTMITAEHKESWNKNGFVKVRGFLAPPEVAEVQSWIEEIAARPASDDKWLHHREETPAGIRLSRTENFMPFHDGMHRLLTEGKLPSAIGELLGEPAVLYKEKINYKYPGGGGYAAHQDAPAYEFVDRHVTCLLTIDAATPENGCLFFAAGHHQQGLLPMDDTGCIAADIADTLDWQPLSMQPGDALFFCSYAPHKSPANTTNQPRRSLYLTYNALADGDLREQYYQDKRQTFAQQSGDEADGRISKIGHFRGKSVT